MNLRDCPLCGLIATVPDGMPGIVATCPRCHHRFGRIWHPGIRVPLAWALAAAAFYGIAVFGPFVQISLYGRTQLADIVTGPLQLSRQGFDLVGLLVLAVTVVFPGLKLAIVLTTLIGLELRRPARLLRSIFCWYPAIGPWAMIDVYLLGFLVAYTRLTAMATVHLDLSLFSLVGLMISMAALDGTLDTDAIWRRLDSERDAHRVPRADQPMAGLIGCRCCGLVDRAVPGDACVRCDTILRDRKPASVARCWAFVIAAVALYIPANVFPVMLITQVARTTPFTIMGGIVELFVAGLWPLGLLVLLASIAIPLVKLLSLICMLIETQRRTGRHLRAFTRIFRVVDFIGRWSMIDVFMISILVALVRFGAFANVDAATGAACFAAVVVLTMFAVSSFDLRLMWDAHDASMGDARSGAAAAAPVGAGAPAVPI